MLKLRSLNKALITNAAPLLETVKTGMCEFNVFFNGKSQIKDVVYAKSENNTVTVKSILGETKEFKNCRILEVDVNHERLVLESVKA
jgi:predicted RNA-binding protein